MIRSAYRTKMRFFSDSDEETPVEWYFAAPNAAALGLPTLFGSRAWEYTTELPPAVGEQNARSWRGGLPPGTVGRGGLCGSADQWANGALASDPLPATWPGTSLPVCCTPSPMPVAAGAAVGPLVPVHVCRPILELPDALKVTFVSSDNPWQYPAGSEWTVNRIPEGTEGLFIWPNYLSDPFDADGKTLVIYIKQEDFDGCEYALFVWRIAPDVVQQSGPYAGPWQGLTFDPFKGQNETALFVYPYFSEVSTWTVEEF